MLEAGLAWRSNPSVALVMQPLLSPDLAPLEGFIGSDTGTSRLPTTTNSYDWLQMAMFAILEFRSSLAWHYSVMLNKRNALSIPIQAFSL